MRLHLGPLVLPETLDQYRDTAGLSDDGRVAVVVSYRRLDRPDDVAKELQGETPHCERGQQATGRQRGIADPLRI